MRFRNVVSLGVCFLATSPVFAQVPEVAGQANAAVQSSSQVGQADAALQSVIDTQSTTSKSNVSSSLNADVNRGTINASQNAVQGTVQGQVWAGSTNGQICSDRLRMLRQSHSEIATRYQLSFLGVSMRPVAIPHRLYAGHQNRGARR